MRTSLGQPGAGPKSPVRVGPEKTVTTTTSSGMSNARLFVDRATSEVLLPARAIPDASTPWVPIAAYSTPCHVLAEDWLGNDEYEVDPSWACLVGQHRVM